MGGLCCGSNEVVENVPKIKTIKSEERLDFGRYEGYWSDPEDQFLFEMVLDSSNFQRLIVESLSSSSSSSSSSPLKQSKLPYNEHLPYAFEGFLEWRLLKAPDSWPEMQERVHLQSMEWMRGYYYNSNTHSNPYQFISLGYYCVESSHETPTIQTDAYK